MIGLASMLREHGRSALLTQTVAAPQTETHTAPYLSTIADAILTLDYSVHDFEMSRTLRVIKMRGSAHVTNPYRLEIGPGGLTVEPHGVRLRELASPVPSADALQGVSLLLVEDYDDTRSTLRRLLETQGATVEEASNAAAAFALLEQKSFDTILCDLGLPDEDGLSLIGRVRAGDGKAARTPAIALTAWGLTEDRLRALRAGFGHYLVKPVDPETLTTTIRSLVGKEH
jgi:CheY-like chemotaxis protein